MQSGALVQLIYALGKEVPEPIELGAGCAPRSSLDLWKETSVAGAGNRTVIRGLSSRTELLLWLPLHCPAGSLVELGRAPV